MNIYGASTPMHDPTYIYVYIYFIYIYVYRQTEREIERQTERERQQLKMLNIEPYGYCTLYTLYQKHALYLLDVSGF